MKTFVYIVMTQHAHHEPMTLGRESRWCTPLIDNVYSNEDDAKRRVEYLKKSNPESMFACWILDRVLL